MNIIYQTQLINVPSIASAATALAENTDRRYWSITNTGTNPLFIRLGSGASSTVFHYVLKGGTGASDGLGASVESSAIVYTGIISIAGTGPAYVAVQM